MTVVETVGLVTGAGEIVIGVKVAGKGIVHYVVKRQALKEAKQGDIPVDNLVGSGRNVPDNVVERARIDNILCTDGACFTEGTLIHTIHGLKPIETVERGELVWSREEFGEKYDYRPVIATKVTPNVPIYKVKVQHDNGLEETFSTTEEHPFWIDGQGWRKASILEEGMRLLDKQGKATATVISQTALDKTDTVYNFEVQEFSTYHIGELGVWVHNANCCLIPQIIDGRIANTSGRFYPSVTDLRTQRPISFPTNSLRIVMYAEETVEVNLVN